MTGPINSPDDDAMSQAAVAELGQRLGAALGAGYTVDRPLGAGGFAVVFLVHDLALKRNLAVKVLSPDLVSSRSVLDRFRREAETVAQLSHPNIVPLHFIGQQDDLLFLAMQCVDGGSIADRLKVEGKLPVDDAARVMSEVAGALAHAHKRGVVHRDIKPGNVLIDAESGRCLVTDFGIARSADGGSLTATGVVIGTPAYLAPEQITGEGIDARTDIFALGVMGYEMVAGKLPFEGANPTAAMMRRLAEPPEPIAKVRPDVSAELAATIGGCLEIDREARFQTAGDVVRSLGGQTTASGSRMTGGGAAAKASVRRGRMLARISAAAVLVVIGGVVVSKWRAPVAPPAPAASVRADSSMALVAAGDYTIGFETGAANARPVHMVRLAAFAIDRTEVTVGAYRDFVDSTNARAPWVGAVNNPQLPVTRVIWSDATNYCAWRHKRGGRLPTEEEWEGAARGREGRTFSWGNQFDFAAANTLVAQRDGAAPVRSFPRGATPEGIHDMIGNVWEWTSSELRAYPGGPAMTDSMRQFRVIRGGASNTRSELATAWFRGYQRPSAQPADLAFTGFRCVVPVEATPAKSR